MKRTLAYLIVLFALVLAACQPATPTAAPATQPPAATKAPTQAPTNTPAPTTPPEKVVTIGFTASLTGKLNVESTRQNNGLKLWMDQVNAAGGIKLADGTIVKFQAKFYDDESNADRVQELYTKLVTEDKADFLISPYSSGLADAAAVIAQQYEKIMITTGAAAEGTYKKGYTLVYQTYTPAGHYLTGAIDLLASLDPNVKKIAIVHENDKFSTAVSDAVKAYAEGKGYEVVLYEGYDSGTTDFAPIVTKIESARPEVVIGGGHFADGQQFAKAIYEKNLPVKMIALLVAPPEAKFAEIGDAALGVIGPSQWEPLAAFKPDYGPTGEEFVKAYKEAFGEEPSYHAAGGYAAGLILQKAIETAGSLDTQAIKQALDNMDMTIFFGHIKFDTSAEQHGLQIGHEMVYIQWQKDASGNLVKQVIWPEAAATAKPLYPIR
ncbi:MAG: amino acid ABC transporter substrate-binding protein [Chloroflexi bacterium]|nr:amino acid ABC transporter substrate-binding protein [Chloroflexota bacterium]